VKLHRSLTWRVVLTGIVAGLFGAVVVIAQMRGIALEALGESVRAEWEESQRAACETAPAGWMLRGPGDSTTWAYDAATLRSENQRAPEIDPASVRRLVLGASIDLAPSRPLVKGGRLGLLLGSEGPCSLLVTEYSGRHWRDKVERILITTFVATVLSGVSLGLLLVAWPFSRRASRLRRAADALGTVHGFEAGEAGGGDELDVVLARLVAADTRIRADADALRSRSRALQRHLGDVAHDVRTPLAALQLRLEQLTDAAAEEGAREQLTLALGDCVYLSGLAENLRVRSLVEEGRSPEPAPIADAGSVVERIARRAAALAQRKGV
jgi:signal transduction histidine kinase